MDKITHEVRMEKWKSIVEACNARPKGQSARDWLNEQGISRKSYYYWQRKIRQEAYDQMQQSAVPATCKDANVTFAELSVSQYSGSEPVDNKPFHADAVIKSGQLTIAVSNSVSGELLKALVEVTGHVS